MAEEGSDLTRGNELPVIQLPKSAAIAVNGITTGRQCAAFLSALVGDVMEGRVTFGTANAATNAIGKLLKVVEMQHRYGSRRGDDTSRTLTLTE